jgi:uncharacterized membrane protein YccC
MLTHLNRRVFLPSEASLAVRRLAAALRAAGPPLLFGLRLWASVTLALYVAFWLELDNPFWAGTSAAIVCLPQLGASLRKAWFRMIGTLAGAVMSVVLVACFPQDRILFLGALALWGAACSFVSALLRNFASYSAMLAGYTTAIIAGDLLGATGGVNANEAFLLAVTRASEIGIGIVSAGVVLAGTDLGGARRRLAALFADLVIGIVSGFGYTLTITGGALSGAQPVRREFLRRVIALDPVIDETIGESSPIRYHSPVLQQAVDGLFAALNGWRAAANHLARLPQDRARDETALILIDLPAELRPQAGQAKPAIWMADPIGACRICEATVQRLLSLPAETPSLRLLLDKTAEALAGLARALNGLALLVAEPAKPERRRYGIVRLRVPDWLPALVTAGRAFVVIGTVAVFWIVTAWPGGSLAITFAAIVVLLLGTRADQAYVAALLFTVGVVLDLFLAAIVLFAVLPALHAESFAALSLVIGLVLLPVGALLAQAHQPWQVGLFTAMAMQFMPLLQPTNPMTYDPLLFYNVAVAVVGGFVAAALSFRLLPPLSPSRRTARLLALTLRDLRSSAAGRTANDWEGRVRARLAVMPDEATPLQRAQLLAALSVGSEIIRLRQLTRELDLGAEFDPVLASVAQGDSSSAAAHLARLDAALAACRGTEHGPQAIMRARASTLSLSEALDQHAVYFGTGAQG